MAGAVGYVVGGRYRLTALVGQGGMGRVWRAVDGSLGREVAVKEIALPPSLSEEERGHYVARMQKEARSAARLSHPNVITVHDVVHEGGVPWIVMEFVTGESLGSVLKRGPLPWSQAVQIGAQVASALAHAHERQIVHRDLKPDNVLLAGRRVVLTDFGIARVLDETARQTSTGAVIGTPQYMSPEQVQGGTLGPATDLWSLGVLLYGAVEGALPYTGPTVSALFGAILTQQAAPPRQAGPVTTLVMRLLAKDPAQRPPATQVAEFLATLAHGQAGPPPQPRPAPGSWQLQYVHDPHLRPGAQPGTPLPPASTPQPASGFAPQPGSQIPYIPGRQMAGPGGQPQARPYIPQQQPWMTPGAVSMPGVVYLATWGQRVGATLIDGLCLIPGYIAYGGFFATFKGATTNPYTGATTLGGPTPAGWVMLIIAIAYLLGFGLWQLYSQGTTGQTVGKRALNIRVIREADGRHTGFGGAFVRSLAHYLDALACYIGFLAPLWDLKNQTFADKICHTVVIRG